MKDSQETLGLKLCACRSQLEKFVEHQLVTAHSCLAIPDTLLLSSCILPVREWRGDDPEGYFGDLGAWAERRMKELGVD